MPNIGHQMTTRAQDLQLINGIQSRSVDNEEYWAFRGRAKRSHCHSLLQYPAMMVPEMQGELMDAVMSVDTNIRTTFDPFVGSGTILSESMARGLDFTGIDINPLSVLSCEVKSGPLYVNSLEEKIEYLFQIIQFDRSTKTNFDFPNIDKWFTPTAQSELSKIRRAILLEPAKWARKFYWLAMASAVRTCCNSRSSTYKLHLKPALQISAHPSPITIFKEKLLSNMESIKQQKELLESKGYLHRSRYASEINIVHGDTKNPILTSSEMDLLVSSPPYGDNQTTVPYGQYSYLPLMWIDINDIDSVHDATLLCNQSAIDSNSLGGFIKDHREKRKYLLDKSYSFIKAIYKVERANPENTKKLVSFIYDLEKSLINSIDYLRDSAYMVWTLGNRRVSNIEIPLDHIMIELLENRKCTYVQSIERTIPSKRMATRNQISETMGKETILIMRK